jgi:hypothetical protein
MLGDARVTLRREKIIASVDLYGCVTWFSSPKGGLCIEGVCVHGVDDNERLRA